MRWRRSSATYGNARHPAADPVIPGRDPGPGTGANTTVQAVQTNGPSAQAVQLAQAMALVENTASPMSRGSRIWAQDAADPTRRMTGRVDPVKVPGLNRVTGIDEAVYSVRPILHPTAVRAGFQSGASQQPAYPSTGGVDSFGAPLAWMSIGQVGMGLG